MLPTFVIGLREGLEAALIVGIIAAFLRKQGRRDLLRWVLLGVAIAVGLCVAAGVALKVYSQNLPQKQQEGLETVIAVLAIGMVTYMVVWMRRNSRNLKGQLEGLAAHALSGASGAGRAMILMAFLAVIREGLETVVFLLAAFSEAGSTTSAGFGAVLGIVVAVGLGYGIYRGGVRLNLSKFFRATGLVLVLVAAGLVVNALHTAHEAGWLNAGQGSTIDLSWLVQPGTVQASLLTGMLGLQPRPVVVEIVGWLLYLIPVGLYVAWPPGRPVPARTAARVSAAVAVVAAAAAAVLAVLAPAAPVARPTTSGGGVTVQVTARGAETATVRLTLPGSAAASYRLTSDGTGGHRGTDAERFVATVRDAAPSGPATLGLDRIAALNGGRLPVGIRPSGTTLPVTYRATATLNVWLDTRTDRVLDVTRSQRTDVVATSGGVTAVLTEPLRTSTAALPAATAGAAVAAARDDHGTLADRSRLRTLAGWATALAVLALVCLLGFGLVSRRRPPAPVSTTPEPSGALVRR